MEFMALLPIFNTLIDRIFPDKEKQDAAKLELQKATNDAVAQQLEAQSKQIQSQADVVKAEVQSESYAARNWRPHLMYMIMILLLNNYLISPILVAFGVPIIVAPIPPDMWTLLTIGVGGYVVGKSGEKMVSSYSDAKFNNTAFFSVLKNKMFKQGMTQAQVDVFNQAVSEAEK